MLKTVASIIAVLVANLATAADQPRKVWTAAEVMAVSGMTPPPAEADSPEASAAAAPDVAAPTKTNAGATPQKRAKSNAKAKTKAKTKTKARIKARTAAKAKASGKTAKKTPSAKNPAKRPRKQARQTR